VRLPTWQEILLYIKLSRLASEPTQPSVQLLPEALPWG